ncbi:MAG: GAF domain-containing protein, partial [Psychromonas sp.]|nr:GAF domain-containing protein [Psychromonas sp.]
MMQQVTDRNTQVETQSWLKTQVVKVNKLSQGINDTQEMAQALVSELAVILNAGHVVFYLLEEAERETDNYLLLASYAYVQRKKISNHFAPGEGLVGQCALEKQNILLTDIPDDYIKITSGLGERTPLNIIALPILFEKKCLAVIEIASFKPFEVIHIDFLNQTAANL